MSLTRPVPLVLTLGLLMLVVACSSSGSGRAAPTSAGSGGATASTPALVTPAPSPTGMTAVTVGSVTVSIPAGMTQLPDQGSDAQEQVVGYRSAPDANGTSGVVLVTVANTATRSAAAEAQALVGLKRDVQHATGIKITPVTWTGFASAYAVTYDDPVTTVGKPALHTLVVIAQTRAGPLVNVTAKAPQALFTSLDLAASVASLAPSGASA